MAEYHWNEQPSDLLALLDNSASLPPLDGFDTPAFGAPDIFSSLEPSAPTLEEPVAPQSLPYELDVPDVAGPSHVIATPPVSLPHPVLKEVSEGERNSENDYSTQPSLVTPNTPESTETAAAASLSSAASDVTVGVSAVEAARKAAEDFANGKVSERKRKLKAEQEEDGKRRKGNDGGVTNSDDDDAPEKISHRKYQKRLQKNRDSAYVSRIRRREYTKRLEEGLNRVEKEKNELASRYDALQRKFEVVVAELNTLKEATAARFKALAGPVGAAGKPKNAGALVTTMFMCALIFGCMVPDSLTARYSASHAGPAGAGGVGPNPINFPVPQRIDLRSSNKDSEKGRVWARTGGGPFPPPTHWKLPGQPDVLGSFSKNVSLLFGPENGAEMVEMLQTRVAAGGVSTDNMNEMARKANEMVRSIDTDAVKRTLPSRRSKLFRKALRKLAKLADDCFTKELIALLTIRLIPMDRKLGIK